MDPSQHSNALSALVISIAVLLAADCLVSWLCARERASGPSPTRSWGPSIRAGLRAGQAAGFFAVFDLAQLPFPLAILMSAAAFLASAVVLSDLLVPRLASRRSGATAQGDSATGTPGAEARMGLSVVASRAERLKDTLVARLMVPRKSIVGCDSSAGVEEAASIMVETGLSRIIAYGKTLDRPLGLAHIKDVLPLMYEGKGRSAVEGLLRPLVLVPSTARALDLLRDFQRLKRRVAIVRDIHEEKTLGLVSTEDILEEMVGEIRDKGEALSESLEGGVALVRGDLKVSDLTRELGMAPLRDKGELSLGELVKSLLGREARKGDVVSFRGLSMEVEETVNGEVWMVRIDRAGE